MAANRSVRRVCVGDMVRVCVDHKQDLLHDMELYGPDKTLMTNVHMFGVVQTRSPNHYSVFMPAAEEALTFAKERCIKVTDMSTVPKVLYVVIDKKIKPVKGLLLPSTYLPADYYSSEKDAKDAVSDSDVANASAVVSAAVTVPSVPPPIVPTTSKKNIQQPTSSNSTPESGSTSTRRTRARRRDAAIPSTEGNLTDASESDEDLPDLADVDTSDSDDSDSMTDEEEEFASEHEEEKLKWQPPKSWPKEREDLFVRMCGEAEWTAPANREDCASSDTGAEQDCVFNVMLARKVTDLFFEALPLTFWRELARTSLQYAKLKFASEVEKSRKPRAFKESWFTASNYIRVFAAIIMRGLVSSRDDPDFFNDVVKGEFVRTGAQKVIGITINQYQQLLRFMHFRGTEARPAPQDDRHDKCWHVRPLIELLQRTFCSWCIPGKNNAMDEAGVPSRHRWLRCYNPSKPTKYFIEILMACDSVTRFCWAFFVTESTKKTVVNTHRNRVKGKFVRVNHYQHEYGRDERRMQDRYGASVAQMSYFARKLREFTPDNAMTYRIFADSRWDSILGIVYARKHYNVSYTSTIKKLTDRFHVVKLWKKSKNNSFGTVVKSKKRSKRGKYRAAWTMIDGVRLTTCLWNDSGLLGAISADLGSENCDVERRMSYHKKPISCPRLMFIRGKFFRAVDQSDQLRMCKWRMVFTCKRKAWPRLAFGLVEMLIVNIYVMKLTIEKSLAADDYRWELVLGMVERAKLLDVQEAPPPTPVTRSAAYTSQTSTPGGCYVPRREGASVHHHDELREYIFPHEFEYYQRLRDANPCQREHHRQPRERDAGRADGKVRNPIYTSYSLCLVCKYRDGKRKETLRYCRECNVDDFVNWPKTNRATGFQKLSHPRLCSRQCFEYFHTHNIPGLDYGQKRKRAKRARSSRIEPTPTTPIQAPNHTPNPPQNDNICTPVDPSVPTATTTPNTNPRYNI